MTTIIKHRHKITALLLAALSLVLPGIGHIFAARFNRGMVFLGMIFIASFFYAIGGMKFFFSAVLIYSVLLLIWLYMAYDTYKLNTVQKGIPLKQYNKWYLYIVFAIGICGFMNIVIAAMLANYLHFTVAVDTNSPSLQKGEIVMAQMNYGHNPGYFIAKPPNSFGDIYSPVFIFSIPKYTAGSYILFTQSTGENKTFLRKIVAVSGDVIAQKGKKTMVPQDNVLVSMNNDDNYELVLNKDIKGKILYVLFSSQLSRIGLRID